MSQKYFFEGIQNGVFYEGLIDPVSGAPTSLTPVDAASIPGGTPVYPTSVPDVSAVLQSYYIDTIQYTQGQTIVANCNAIAFKNLGAPTVSINGIVLLQNQGVSISGNQMEIDVTKYIISFAGAGQAQLLVIRKCYN